MESSLINNQWIKTTFFGLFVLCTGLQILTLNYYGLDILNTCKDSFLSNLLLVSICWLVTNVLSFYKPKNTKYIYVVIWCIILAVIFSAILLYGLPKFVSTDYNYLIFLTSSLPIRFITSFLVIGLMAMVSILWHKQQDHQELEKRRNEAEKLTKEAELISLREKLQPHFLFNSLNSISALTVTNPEEARNMVHQLSDFLRGTLKKDDVLSSLKSEIDHLQLYLDIEKVRFGKRLNIEIDADENSLAKQIPPMLLQPLVENAIKFGLYDTLHQVTINIKSSFQAPYLTIKIINPFDSETAIPNKGTGFGLSSIKRRLFLFFNRNDLLKTQVENNNFVTIIQIPQI